MELDGVIIIDKPAGITSHDVVARARKILKTRRIGHAGTLDPFATGVLVLCINRATRLVQFMIGDDKEYLATMRLGVATDTGDLTGRPLLPASDAAHITSEMVKEALSHFRGRIKQVPPMYSAKKIGGVKLYEMARRGVEVEREPIVIEIKELELITSKYIRENHSPDFSFRVLCSSGTYVRALVEDIGRELNVGAHLIDLRRTRAGACDLQRAVTLERLAEIFDAGRVEQLIVPMSEVLAMDELQLSSEELRAVVHGRSINYVGDWLNGVHAKLCDPNHNLIAIADYDAANQCWRPRVVLA